MSFDPVWSNKLLATDSNIKAQKFLVAYVANTVPTANKESFLYQAEAKLSYSGFHTLCEAFSIPVSFACPIKTTTVKSANWCWKLRSFCLIIWLSASHLASLSHDVKQTPCKFVLSTSSIVSCIWRSWSLQAGWRISKSSFMKPLSGARDVMAEFS